MKTDDAQFEALLEKISKKGRTDNSHVVTGTPSGRMMIVGRLAPRQKQEVVSKKDNQLPRGDR
ncbi:hypothetical protein KW800_02210 [Candidatus Parcubacteria bacterium]|nr:hypothetical protein [Candidatus Parcubacteria bacterium]